ncbi:MAG: dihydrolipoyl dehydrogenase [Candidatus Gracilibacteria bacterium]
MEALKFDVIVLGGGPGGTAAAKTLALGGKSVAVVSDELGGECVNYGCIPTKIFLRTAELVEKFAAAAEFGVEVGEAKINWEKVKERKNKITEKLRKNLTWSLEKAGVKIFAGRGEFVDANTISVTAAAGVVHTLSAKNIIVATGSKAIFLPSIPKTENVLGTHEILDLAEIPKTLLIIGGGVTGVEFASMFAAFGTKVTIAEYGSRLLMRADSEISVELERIFARKGIEILKNNSFKPEDIGNYEKVLSATGRQAVVAGFGLEKIGVKVGRYIETNDLMATNLPHIFAIGDCAGKSMLAYTAEREGTNVALQIMGKKTIALDYEKIPSAVFSLPEIAFCGLTEEEAKKRGVEYVTVKSVYSGNSKSLILNSRDGFVKILANKSSGEILGIHIIGEKASEIIAEASLAISKNMTISDLKQNLHCHPVISEVIKEALDQM